MAPVPVPFHFHAHAQALGGEFHRPIWSIVPTQATASLPTVGGHATVEARDFHFEDFIHFKRAHTQISGKQHADGFFVTHASTVISGMTILRRLTFDRIVSRLTSIHQKNEEEGHITAEDSHFEGFRIDGVHFKVQLRHELLVGSKTFADLERNLASSPKFGKIDAKRRVASCTLVDTITPEAQVPGVTIENNVITIENFGKLFLAGVFAEVGTRTLTMLRLQLGSPQVANLAIAESVTNGQPPPSLDGN